MPLRKAQLNRVGLCAFPDDAMRPWVQPLDYAALAALDPATIPAGAVAITCDDAAARCEFWQLRAVENHPSTDTAEGVIRPAGYDGRAWFRR
jgi:hypothetical protein